jgi:hypothetical protein
MKNIFVVLALVAMAGCSHMPWRDSSGGMSSRDMGSSSMGSGTSMPGTDTYNDYTRGTYNPATGLPVPAGP